MVKGISIRFKSYEETIPKLLDVINLKSELKKHPRIILKPHLEGNPEKSTSSEFVEEILKFCLQNKNPAAEIYIVEGSDGEETTDLFDAMGYQKLAEKYSIGLIDLNDTVLVEIEDEFSKFEKVKYPKILLDSFVISLPPLAEDPETIVAGSLSNMLGAYPSSHYSGFFSLKKNKIRKWSIKYSIFDILKCKMPEFAIIDASKKGVLLAGQPLEIDKQAAKLLDKDWKEVPYLKFIDESYSE